MSYTGETDMGCSRASLPIGAKINYLNYLDWLCNGCGHPFSEAGTPLPVTYRGHREENGIFGHWFVFDSPFICEKCGTKNRGIIEYCGGDDLVKEFFAFSETAVEFENWDQEAS